MASQNGQTSDTLRTTFLRRLKDEPHAFDFFHALRLLENHYREQPRIGNSLSPREDPVRFGQDADLAFPTSTLKSFDEQRPGGSPRLSVNFFGLLGPNGPLPTQLTDYTRDRARNARDTTLSSFLDTFHHRMISFFYRAWALNQKSVDYDRPEEGRFFNYLGSFLGLGEPSLLDRDAVPDNAKVYYFGRLAGQSRNAGGLEAIVADYFQVPAEIEPFVAHWLPIPAQFHCRLGVSAESATLGASSILGERVLDVQTRFRIRLGPMGYSRYRDFLPSERSFHRLADWVALYTSHQYHWDVQLVLHAAEVPATQLGGGSLLGWTTWLHAQPFTGDATDMVIDQSETRSELKHYT